MAHSSKLSLTRLKQCEDAAVTIYTQAFLCTPRIESATSSDGNKLHIYINYLYINLKCFFIFDIFAIITVSAGVSLTRVRLVTLPLISESELLEILVIRQLKLQIPDELNFLVELFEKKRCACL
ncbi:hypothetical protein BCV73_24275 [Paenibacillus sp. SSG-1]|nr:hypothetical protein BCV73_24275 [Paenibacillus sp. SSG-1]